MRFLMILLIVILAIYYRFGDRLDSFTCGPVWAITEIILLSLAAIVFLLSLYDACFWLGHDWKDATHNVRECDRCGKLETPE